MDYNDLFDVGEKLLRCVYSQKKKKKKLGNLQDFNLFFVGKEIIS